MNLGQQHLLEMLEEIDAICQANNIDYAVTGGTLIGAVRNGGFLPWDDDADIMMTEDNYRRFREACKTDLPKDRYLRDPATCKDYWHLIPRYVRGDTTAYHTCQSLTDGDVAGEVIDIFVLDPIADGTKAYESYLQDLYLYESVVNYSNVAATRVELDPALCEKYLRIRNEQGRDAAAQLLEQRLESHLSEEGSHYVYRWQSVPYLLERSWFSSYVRVPFEGVSLSAPKEINAYLTNYFGENWTEIPGNIKPAKHNAAASLSFPYTEALTYYTPAYDRSELLRQMDERKLTLLKHAPTDNALKDQRVRIKAAAVGADLRRGISAHREAFEAAYEAHDGRTLASLMREYLSFQTSAEAIGRFTGGGMYRWMRPVLIEVDDETFTAGLWALLETDRFRFIVRLVDLFERAGRTLTDDMRHIRDGVLELRAIMDLNQDGRFDETTTRAEKLVRSFPKVRFYREQLVESLAGVYANAPTAQNRDALEEAVQEAERRFPEDGFFVKHEADLLAEHDPSGAQVRYLQAAEHTRNGIVLSEIARKTGYWPTWLRTPSWAKDAGVPQWDGPDPEPLEEDSGTVAAQNGDALASIDVRKAHLLGLLGELGGICDEQGIAYIVAPELVGAWLDSEHLPSQEESYRIIVTPDGFGRLLAELEKSTGKTRLLEHFPDNSKLPPFEARWYDTGTLRMSLKSRKPQSKPYMRVGIVAAEPKQRSFWTLSALRFATGKTPSGMTPQQLRLARLYRRGRENDIVSRHAFAHACRARFADDELFVRGGDAFRLERRFLESTEPMTIAGVALSAPRDVAGYAQCAQADACEDLLQEPPGVVYSCATSCSELTSQGVLDKEFYERKTAAWDSNAGCRETMKRFRANFKQMKYAVGLKEASLQLLPRKAEILELAQSGETEALEDLFAGLRDLERKFKGAGEPMIDDEIYAIYRELGR